MARTSIFILVFLAMRLLLVWHPFHSIAERYLAIFSNSGARCVGAGITVLGIGFAIWARSHLGRNWGQPMTLRQGHELVTTGPYALVRHPIYTGMIFAFFGTALAANVFLLIPFAVLSGFFILSAMMEEKHMLRQFPDDYPEYTRRTKMLIPYVI